MTIARRGRAALGGSDGCLGAAFGRTGCFARILGLAPRGRSNIAFVLAGLLDARPLGIARGGEPDRLGVDARLFGSLFDDDVVDLLRISAAGYAGSDVPRPSRGRRRAS